MLWYVYQLNRGLQGRVKFPIGGKVIFRVRELSCDSSDAEPV
jgi:hypothetical protein